MEDSRALLHSSAGDHHCHDHAHFTANCDGCQRARAAFLPYQNVAAHPEPASRSFQFDAGSTFVVDSIGFKEAVAYGVADGMTEGLLDGLLDL